MRGKTGGVNREHCEKEGSSAMTAAAHAEASRMVQV